jgi:hypothetical protein
MDLPAFGIGSTATTMESENGRQEVKESLYGNVVNDSRVDKPVGWTANNSTYVSRLRKNTYKEDP